MVKRRGNNLPFDEAREFIHTQCIGSRKQYIAWHVDNKPKQLPKYPNRVYTEDWDGWNDWLGTDNKFDNKKKFYRPLAEAIVWVHKLGIGTKEQWFEHIRGGDNLPNDVPSRPDLVYDDWRSWMHFLGNNPREKVQAQQKAVKEAVIFYVIQEAEYMGQRSVFTFGLEKGGRSGLKDRWEGLLPEMKFRVIKMYEYDNLLMDRVWTVIKQRSTPYYGSEEIRIVPNVNQLAWDIGDVLYAIP